MEKTLNSARNLLFVEFLRDTRMAMGVTQVELAERLGIHQTEVSRVERGSRRLDLMELDDWLAALEVPRLEFMIELFVRIDAMKLQFGQGRRQSKVSPKPRTK